MILENAKFFFAAAFFGFTTGLCGSLMFAFGFVFAFRAPVWSLALTAFFLLFHLSDLMKFWKDKNLAALFGRIIVVFVLSNSISALVWMAIKISLPSPLEGLFIVACIILGIFLTISYLLLKGFFPQSRAFLEIEHIKNGLYLGGVFWKN